MIIKADSKIARLFALFVVSLSLIAIVAIAGDIIARNQGAYLILFSLAYVLFPGFLTVIMLDKDFAGRFKTWTPVISFYVGFFLLIVQYYLLNLLGILHWIRFTPLLICVVLLFLVRKRLSKVHISLPSVSALCKAAPFLALLAVVMIASYYMFVHTVPNEDSNVFLDYCYHMGNINILTRGGNIEDTRVMGMTFKYHYFMDLYYAILRLVFPVKIWNCVFRFPTLLVSPLICESVYALIQSKTSNRCVTFVCSVLAILFPSVVATTTLLPNHIITNVNSVGVALPLAVCVVEMIGRTAVKENCKYKDLGILFALMITLTGIKGPFALPVVGASIIFLFYCIIERRKFSLYQVLSVAVLGIAFAIIWFSILDVAATGANVTGDAAGIRKYLQFQITVPELEFGRGFIADGIDGVMFIPQNLIMSFAGATIPFIIMIPIVIFAPFSKKRMNGDYRTVICAICACCGVGMNYLMAVGYNRNYFFMFAVPFVYYMAADFITLIKKIKKSWISILSKSILVIAALIAVFAIYNGIKSPFIAYGTGDLTYCERETVLWIKDNTPVDALFAISENHPNNKKYYYSGYTERRFYLESYLYSENSGLTADDLSDEIAMNQDLFFADNSAQLVNELGVDYLIYYKRADTSSEVLDKYYTLCFDNSEISVYSVTEY